MILNFYVQGKPPGSSSTLHKDPSESYFDATVHWTGEKASRLSELTLDEAVEWTKDHVLNAWERSKRAFRYLSGAPLPPMSIPEHPPVDMKENKKAQSTGWSFVGMFSGLRGTRVRSTETNEKRADREMWADGEVHADLIRVCFVLPNVGCQTDTHTIER
jgi:import inner membrane translocase subunit TIM21